MSALYCGLVDFNKPMDWIQSKYKSELKIYNESISPDKLLP